MSTVDLFKLERIEKYLRRTNQHQAADLIGRVFAKAYFEDFCPGVSR
jgi:hypothetical protein